MAHSDEEQDHDALVVVDIISSHAMSRKTSSMSKEGAPRCEMLSMNFSRTLFSLCITKRDQSFRSPGCRLSLHAAMSLSGQHAHKPQANLTNCKAASGREVTQAHPNIHPGEKVDLTYASGFTAVVSVFSSVIQSSSLAVVSGHKRPIDPRNSNSAHSALLAQYGDF